MAAVKRHPDEIRRDRETIAKLYMQGKSQYEIAEVINAQYSFTITQQQVSSDLKVIRDRWLESSIRDFDAAKSEQLAKIDLMESEAWEAWDKSKETAKVITRKQGGKNAGEVTTRIERQTGNPAYLNIVDRCIERRCRLLGLDAELKYADLNLAISAVVRAGYVIQNPNLEAGNRTVELPASYS